MVPLRRILWPRILSVGLKSKVVRGFFLGRFNSNCVLLCKWLWRMSDSNDLLWKSWMENEYYNGNFTVGTSLLNHCSNFWKSVVNMQ